MKIPKRNGHAAFTIIELLVVITIIGILATLVVAGMGFAKEKQNREKAKIQVALIAKALEEYKLDNGHYPYASGTGTENSHILFQALFHDGIQDDSRIYLSELDPSSNKQGWTTGTATANTTITDPWGNEYRYRSAVTDDNGTENSNTENPDFDLWSIGKDGKHNDEAPDHKDNGDNISA